VLQEARQHWPISLHGVGLGLGSAIGIDPWHLDQLEDLVVRTEPLMVSDHACFARGFFPKQMQSAEAIRAIHASDLLPIPFTKEALSVLCSNVQLVQERLKRTIAVENLSAYFAWREADFSETQFLTELTKRTGCQLLVDVNNIYVNSLNAQKAGLCDTPLTSCQAWLDAIPTDAVAEIHLAGHSAMEDIVIDDHSCKVRDPVWELYRYAMQRFKVNTKIQTLIEWDTDIPALSVLLDQAALAKRHAGESNA